LTDVTAEDLEDALGRLADGLAAHQILIDEVSRKELSQGVDIRVCEALEEQYLQLRGNRLSLGRESRIVSTLAESGRSVIQLGLSVGRAATESDAVATRRGLHRSTLSTASTLTRFAWRELVDGRLDRTALSSSALAGTRVFALARGGTDALTGRSGGLNVESNGGIVRCVDHGGILDLNPNTEGDPWPPQAMGMYYAAPYAAYVFARQWRRERGGAWLQRASAAHDFTWRTYFDHRRSAIWNHHDFKNAPLIETAELIGPNDLSGLDVKKLVSDLYQPANVLAVRMLWHALRGLSGDETRIRACRKRLTVAVDSDGLLSDDWPGITQDVRDLGYTGFMAGFLARYLQVRPEDAAARSILERAVAGIAQIATESGEFSFFGRGVNSTYQSACAAFALLVSSRDCKPSDYKVVASRLLRRLLTYQDAYGMFPSSCNSSARQRMAWNTCSTSYSALIGYFLEQCRDLILEDRGDHQVSAPSPSVLQGWAGTPRILRSTTSSSELVVVAPGGQPVKWSGNRRTTAYGLAYLGMRGDDSLIASPDWLLRSAPLVNLPLPSDVDLADLSAASLTVTGQQALLVVPTSQHKSISYRISHRGSVVELTTDFSGRTQDTARWVWRMGLVGEWALVPTQRGTIVARSQEFEMVLEGPIEAATTEPLLSNPRGTGTLLTCSGEVHNDPFRILLRIERHDNDH
jgi:hypothetical protein